MLIDLELVGRTKGGILFVMAPKARSFGIFTMKLIRLVLVFATVAIGRIGWAQVPTDTATVVLDSNAVVRVDKIFIIGNRRTKPRIIRREMNAQPQTAYVWHELREILANDRRRIINTQLFVRVDIRRVLTADDQLDLIVSVSERWYTIPSPIIRLATRNFNDWRTNYDYDPRWLEYGMKLTQYNFRGLNERLRLAAQFGFTRQFSAQYDKPYIDAAQKNGLSFSFSFSETNNIIYQTEGNQPEATDSLRRVRKALTAGIGWRHRGSYYTTHALDIDYFHNRINDTITELNPRYFFGDARPSEDNVEQRYFQVSYRFVHDKRDLVGYPLHGFLVNVRAQKLGLGVFDDINLWRLSLNYERYVQVAKRLFVTGAIRGMTSAPARQPYANLTGLGYDGQWLRGYEVYLIEGQHFVLQQNALSWQLFNTVFNLDRIVPIEQFDKFPIAIYLKAFFDQGAVRTTTDYPLGQALNNRYLYSAGLGIDVVSFYDFVLRFGYPLAVSQGVRQQYFFSIGASF